MPKKDATEKQIERIALQIWWDMGGGAQEVFNTLWYEGITGEEMFDELAKRFPKLYSTVISKLIARLESEGMK